MGVSVSLPGLLATMAGLTLLYCYWRMNWAVELKSGLSRTVALGGGFLIAAWGLNEVAVSIFSSYRGKRVVRTRTTAEAAQPAGLRRLLSLFGVLLIGAGAAVSLLIAVRVESGTTVAVGITAGVLLIMWGIRNVVEALRPQTGPRQALRKQTLAVPGIVYLFMMVVFLMASLIGRSNMLMLVFSLMAGPFVLNGWITFRMLLQTGVTRRVPRRVMAGEPVDVEVTLENDKTWMSSWLMDVTDNIRSEHEQLQSGVLFTRVPPRKSQTAAYRVRFARRGRYSFGPLAVTSRFPLGFVERGLEFELTDEVVVYPQLGRLTSAWRRETRIAAELVEREDSSAGIYDDEFHRLREHRWGDNPRAIHWRTSARHNELMVREFHQTRDRDLVVLLDLWQPKKATDEDRERVELAVSFAASICIDHMRSSRESVVSLHSSGKKTSRWEGQASPKSFDSLLELLALVEAGPSASVAPLLADAGAQQSAATRLILVTTRPQGTAAPVAVGGNGPGGNAASPRLETFVARNDVLGRFLDLST